MGRQEHVRRQNVDVVIGNDRTFCFDGFDDAAASTLEYLPENSSPPGNRQN